MTDVWICEKCGHENHVEFGQPDLAVPLDDETPPRLRGEDRPPEWGTPLE